MSTSSISASAVSERPTATWKTPSGRPALAQALEHQQRGQRRRGGGLEHGRVAGRQRRDAVAEGVRQRVVPRADDADHADRPVAHDAACARARTGSTSGSSRRPGTAARAWPRSRSRRRRRRPRRRTRPRRSCRSPRRSSRRSARVLSTTHFCARLSMRARPSKPSRLPRRLHVAGVLDDARHVLRRRHRRRCGSTCAGGRVLDGDAAGRAGLGLLLHGRHGRQP